MFTKAHFPLDFLRKGSVAVVGKRQKGRLPASRRRGYVSGYSPEPQRCGALDEIGVGGIMALDVGGGDVAAIGCQIVGQRQQGADENAIAFGAFRQPGVAV